MFYTDLQDGADASPALPRRRGSAVSLHLSQVEVRVLGALVEKDITTPDYYPLSLNALVNACNQKNNRDPVMTLDADTVRGALDMLQEKRLAGPSSSADSRVPKYEHRLQEMFNFTRAETAILCVLLLRGPQTPGELRGRTERMHPFETLEDVQSTLQRLVQRDEPLVKMLSRQPGTKESRYMQLLGGEAAEIEGNVSAPRTPPAVAHHEDADGGERLSHLEQAVADLQEEIAGLKQQLAAFRRQFE